MNTSNKKILWYYLECPQFADKFSNPKSLRTTFLQQKREQISEGGLDDVADEGLDD